VFDWIKTDARRKAIREDRQYIVGRTQRFLRSYLSADGPRKHRFYEAVEGASAASRPTTDSLAEDREIAKATAEAALQVVKRRTQLGRDSEDHLAIFITDAYATVAMAYAAPRGRTRLIKKCSNLGLQPSTF
jgi:hypothetical protein